MRPYLAITTLLCSSVSFAKHATAHSHRSLNLDLEADLDLTLNGTLSASLDASVSTSACSYWLEDIQHQGVAAFNDDPDSYQVFRNVKDFGAKGDGTTDDTAAIQKAISHGGRCGPGSCNSTSTTPAVVYFPAGTYMISTNIKDYYYTQMIGNPNCLPTIKAFSHFENHKSGMGLIEGDYGNEFGPTNVFWRQIRNLIIDMTLMPTNFTATGIHWPTSQSTSLQNMQFLMSEEEGTQHSGVYIETGSGGFLNDLVFYGGKEAMSLGNQQFTMRNLTFHNTVTAINQAWDWSFTYMGLDVNNCTVGVNMSTGGVMAQSVGSVTIVDSSFSNTKTAVLTARNSTSVAESLILENIKLNNVDVAVQGATNVSLAGTSSTKTITGWGAGNSYAPDGPNAFEGPVTPNKRPASLVAGDGYYHRSKPQYEDQPLESFISARTYDVRGDGTTDDTSGLQAVIILAARMNKTLFLDHGDYKVSRTIYVPANTRIVGESFSVILSYGDFFSDINSPQPVLQIGLPGESGPAVEISDVIVSTQGAQAGAILVQYNLAAPSEAPSGLWDFHARIGGFKGSELQLEQCPVTPNTATPPAPVNSNCIGAYMTMHITKSAHGLYMENDWLWVADHDVDDPEQSQITIYAGRGLLIESTSGAIWLLGTGVEHHTKYQYQLVNTKNIFMGLIQIETPYYEPNPNASTTFPHVASLHDPVFPVADSSQALYSNGSNATIPSANAWGLRVVDSSDVYVYGAGLYSFFFNYNTDCSAQGNGEGCQTHQFSVEGNTSISVYNLNTVGTQFMISRDGHDLARYTENDGGFVGTIALYRSA